VKLCVPQFQAPFHREDEHRRAAWEVCSRYWARCGLEVIAGTGGESRAAARNAAARLVALEQDVLLFAVADTAVPLAQLREAVNLARTGDCMVLAFRTVYRALQNHAPLDDLLSRPRGYRVSNCSNGVLAVSRRLWEELGGFDERFSAWGGEDRAFLYAAATLRDQEDVPRVHGHAVHLWHPPARDATRPSLAYRSNVRLALRYKAASGREPQDGPLTRLPGATRNRQVMEALLREPGGPRSELTSSSSASPGDAPSGA